MGNHLSEIEARTQREKEAWNTDDIVKAQGFKLRMLGAFRNPHGWKMEAVRARLIRDRCPGAAVLDYGCYEGLETKRYLEYGAAYVCGIDISDTAILRAKNTVLDPRVEFRVADAHYLPFEENSFDLIVGRAILHHLELTQAYSEISRVLKPGGMAMFVEPLRGNPLSKVVRLLTPKARTKDELPLNSADIVLGDKLIGRGRHSYSGFFSAPIGAAVTLCGGSCDNWITRAASVGDDLIGKTSLRYWGRIAFLNFEKQVAASRCG